LLWQTDMCDLARKSHPYHRTLTSEVERCGPRNADIQTSKNIAEQQTTMGFCEQPMVDDLWDLTVGIPQGPRDLPADIFARFRSESA
jgi:hypothetical protein